MTSYITPSSPSSAWAIHPYLGPQPDVIHAIDQAHQAPLTYSPLPSPPSDGASTPRTPPQPALPIPKSPKRSSRKPLACSDTPPPPTKSAVPNSPSAAQQPWAHPTISTFSASSSSFNHIHIVQPYPQGSAASSTGATDLFSNSGIHFVGMGGPSSDGRPPRPANAWILYRSAKMKVLKEPQTSGQPRRTQADISKLIAEMWKNETPEVRQYYEAMSDMKKAEHLAQYPTYRFQPMKKADKEKARLEKKAQKERERAEAALTRSHRSRSRRRQATDPSAADSAQLDGQIAGFPPGTQVLAWGTTPTTSRSTPAFQPYLKPPKRSSSTTARKTHTPPEQSQPSVETPDVKPPSSTVSPSAISGPAPLPTADHLQDWSQTPCSAHPDYSYPSVPSLMVRHKILRHPIQMFFFHAMTKLTQLSLSCNHRQTLAILHRYCRPGGPLPRQPCTHPPLRRAPPLHRHYRRHSTPTSLPSSRNLGLHLPRRCPLTLTAAQAVSATLNWANSPTWTSSLAPVDSTRSLLKTSPSLSSRSRRRRRLRSHSISNSMG